MKIRTFVSAAGIVAGMLSLTRSSASAQDIQPTVASAKASFGIPTTASSFAVQVNLPTSDASSWTIDANGVTTRSISVVKGAWQHIVDSLTFTFTNNSASDSTITTTTSESIGGLVTGDPAALSSASLAMLGGNLSGSVSGKGGYSAGPSTFTYTTTFTVTANGGTTTDPTSGSCELKAGESPVTP